LRAELPGAGAGRPAALAVADHRLEPAAGRPAGRPDGRARPADRPGLRVCGAARPAGGLVDRGVGRRPAAAPHGDRAVRPPGFRAADAAVRPARLPDRADPHPRLLPGVILRALPGAAAGVADLGGGLAVVRGAVHGPAPRPESDRQRPDPLRVRAERRPASLRPGPVRAARFRGPAGLYRAAVAGAADDGPVGVVPVPPPPP